MGGAQASKPDGNAKGQVQQAFVLDGGALILEPLLRGGSSHNEARPVAEATPMERILRLTNPSEREIRDLCREHRFTIIERHGSKVQLMGPAIRETAQNGTAWLSDAEQA